MLTEYNKEREIGLIRQRLLDVEDSDERKKLSLKIDKIESKMGEQNEGEFWFNLCIVGMKFDKICK